MSLAALATALLAGATPSAPARLALPGGAGGIGLDDLRFASELGRVIVPAGRTGRVDLVDPATGGVEVVEGLSRSASRDRGHGEGTTSADAGGGYVFAIDRTARSVVVIDPVARRIVTRARLSAGPDYVRWVAPTGEVWVTEPAREAIETFRLEARSGRLVRTGAVSVPDGPESLVVDPERGFAYTNTFRDSTVAIALRSRAVVSRWPNGCRGARGIALDAERGWVFVGCEEGAAVALDAVHGGRLLGTARAGEGVDGIDFSPQLSHLYVPAADAATLSILGVGAHGELAPLGTIPTAPGAHCAAAAVHARVCVCDPRGGALLVLRDPHPPSR